MVKVVAALIRKGNKILIAKRITGNEEVIGKWEFPGGKVEQRETEQAAIEREIAEELELIIKANTFLISSICKYPTKEIELRLYDCCYIEGDIKLHDHSEYKWINVQELVKYELAPADKPLAEYVLEAFHK